MVITETIDYDFVASPHHGIERRIPVRLDYDNRYERVFPLDLISVTGSPGTPAQYKTTSAGRYETVRIGDPDKVVTGSHRYTIVYRVGAALNGFPDHDELYWNAVGNEWSVPIDRATVHVTAPAELTDVACFGGGGGSRLPCAEATRTGTTAGFNQAGLGPSAGVTVVVGFRKGAVPAPGPVLDERWSATRAFAITPATVSVSLVLLAAVLLGFARLAWRTGRDRRFAGSPVDVAFATEGSEQAVGVFDRTETPVELVPPGGLRPGQLGTLVDEVANTLDVTATITDLAVRGYLRIDEVPKRGWVREAGLDDDQAEAARRPARVRAVAVRRPVRLGRLGASVGAEEHLCRPVVQGSGCALRRRVQRGAGRMPRRTGRGTGVLRRAQGFRRFIEESEKERARFAEQQHLFSEYLPYAIVFGATEKWAHAFAGLDGQLPQPTWYGGPDIFTAAAFSHSIDGFAVTTAGTITSTPAGSGSSGFLGGFSGGGGGGGGGGSW